MNVFRAMRATAVAMLIGIVPCVATAANVADVGDIWWDPNESGWGLQLSQSNTTLFATLYVYDDARFPFWYSGTLTLQSFAGAMPVFSGDLYQTRGPWFAAGSFDPNDVQRGKVGTITFTGTNVVSGVLTYSVSGTTITKNVQRTPLGSDDYSGTYFGVYVVNRSQCTNPADNGQSALLASFAITQSTNQVSMTAAITSGPSPYTCSFSGVSIQLGRMTNVNATYGCTTGESGNVIFSEMTREPLGIVGRIRGVNNLGCTFSGGFSALD